MFLGSGGYPHVKNAVCEKRPGATRTKSHDFGTILGSLGGSSGALFWHLGPPRARLCTSRGQKRPSGRGSGRHVRKMMQTWLTREAAGTLKVRLAYESVGKNHNGLHREKDVFLGGLGDPKMMQKGPRERHYTHHGGSKVPLLASVRRLLCVPFFNDFFVRFSSTFGVRPGVRKWSRRHARAALGLSIIIKFSPFSVLPCGF